ncbi:hypothetical protein D9615_006196 [Tricholomella constricta]|uniref:Uncharacterized protein n=1 Tax=Tricholomella constricta TaxID=117010 RepID=A0A8H5HBC5_9AGAR|nr:hypothetical protein D9615_006196 [Tricholomella constricta]
MIRDMSLSYTSSIPSTSTLGPAPYDMTNSCMPPVVNSGYFAFARIKGDVCLVQVSLDTPASALTTVDVKIFRHEFITIFRLLETRTLHPSDISIIEPINEFHTRYEEENGTVFLARELMGRMQKMSMAEQHTRARIPRPPGRYSTQSSRHR